MLRILIRILRSASLLGLLRGATKQTQNLLEGLSISSDLGTSQDPPGGAEVLLGRKTSGIPCRHIEQTPDKQKKMDSLSRC